MTVPLSVVEFTDPACPWAWGSEPVFRWLRLALGDQARWRRVYGILFDTTEDPAPDPAAETAWYARTLAEISAVTRAPVPADLQWVTRTSWPASITAKAAERQGPAIADRVLRRLRETTFILGTPADTVDSALAAARSVPGIDHERLTRDVADRAVREAVRADWTETREPDPELRTLAGPGPHGGAAKLVQGRHRFALPTVVFTGIGGRHIVPGWRALAEYVAAARKADPGLIVRTPTLSVDDIFDSFDSVTLPELQLLTGEDRFPVGVSIVESGNGPIWHKTSRDGN
jgi:predicted DsbA family dithiol-disulfide isomerase